MKRILLVNFEKCTGCRICELVCSLYHEDEVNPAKSRIHVIKWEEEGIDAPMVCQQCDKPICETVCLVRAPYRDAKTGAMLVNPEKCIGCRQCVISCPFGGPQLDIERGMILKCDLCGGEPKCVEFCSTKALEYVTPTRATLIRKRASAERFGELVRTLTSASSQKG